ncbi:MAG TPA: mechanosensitive ion channel family protein, partial [Salinimicrobium catena]|nr:mechanosensitive ion channel family protein [Salinimicrobium catena]
MRERIREVSEYLANYFIEKGLDEDIAHFLNMLINIAIVFILWYFIHYLTKRVLLTAFKRFTNKTKTTFDDFLVKSNFPRYVSNVLPLLLLILMVPIVFQSYPQLLKIFETLIDIYIIILLVLIARSLLRTTTNYLKR